MKGQLTTLSEKINTLKSKVKSEEATKQSMVLPLLNILGYDIFDPEEVMPEVPCDISGKGDKVDYVISGNGKAQILIECKHCQLNLNNYIDQLKKYFVASEAKFAILTNGINYLFFSDHDKANIMDEKPFYSLNILNLSDDDVDFLSGFCKGAFNAHHMSSKSQELKYCSAIKQRLLKEISDPSREFVSEISNGLYEGKLTDQQYDSFSRIIKDCFKSLLTPKETEVKEVVKEEKKPHEWPEEWSELERKAVDMIVGWLEKYEVDNFKIQAIKLADKVIKISYGTKWWEVCRIKIVWTDELHVKICKEASVKNSIKRYLKSIDLLPSLQDEIEAQCIDSKERFFKYRSEHYN